jgi:hypothetical protein
MGIYYDGKVYGISWKIYDNCDDGDIIKRFEKSYDEKMNVENISEIKEEFDKLATTEKENTKFYVLTSCYSTYEINSSSNFVWYSFKKTRLINFFLNGYDDDIY